MNNIQEQSKQYLTFLLDKDLYAFDVLRVKEVLELHGITRVPRTPEFLAGIINLRGSVVPVVDLRVKFEQKNRVITQSTSVIIVEIEFLGEPVIIGALADAIKSVYRFDAGSLEPPPRLGLNIDLSFIEGIARVSDDFVIILNADTVFSEKELSFSNGARMNPAGLNETAGQEEE